MFDTVLAIHRSEKQRLKLIFDLVRSRMFLLALKSHDKSPINSQMTITFPDETCAATCSGVIDGRGARVRTALKTGAPLSLYFGIQYSFGFQ